MYQLIKKLMLCLSILVFISINNVAIAQVKAVTGQLCLMATLDGKPAFRSVLWKLTPNSPHSRNNNNVSTIRIYKHTATIDLEPGSYQVSVSLENKTLTYHVTIKESSKQELIVDLGSGF